MGTAGICQYDYRQMLFWLSCRFSCRSDIYLLHREYIFMRKQVDIYTRDLDDLQKKTEQLFWPVNTIAGHFLAFVLLQLSCIALSWYLGNG